MAFEVKITPLNPEVEIGKDTTFTATPTDAPEGTLSYAWTVDGVKKGSDKNTIVVKADAAGKQVVKVVLTSTPAEGEPVSVEAESTLTVNLKTFTGSVKLSPANQEVEVGEKYTVTSVVEGVDSIEGLTKTFSWDTGETTESIERTAEVEGDLTPTITVTLKADGYKDKKLTGKAAVTVVAKVVPPEPEPEGCIRYIHPLDHRSSAYIWAGWWVMYEIEAAVKAGIDWKKPDDTELKYKRDLKTLAKMLEDYPNVEVQESKHGYILNKETIEAGYIY